MWIKNGLFLEMSYKCSAELIDFKTSNPVDLVPPGPLVSSDLCARNLSELLLDYSWITVLDECCAVVFYASHIATHTLSTCRKKNAGQ